MALWTIPLEQDGQVLQIPVVNLGASPLPSKVRLYKAGVGYGELPLVYPDDNRGSKWRVRQDGVTYAVAKDERVEITYSPNKSVSMTRRHNESGATTSVLVGRTYFNRVTRIEATIQVGARSWCVTWDVDSHWESTTGTAWIRVVGPVTRNSASMLATAAGHHGGFQAWWDTGWFYKSGAVALDNLPPGQYDVHLFLRFNWRGVPHSGSSGDVIATCLTWKEIARG